jgi:hypothetical protein
LKSAIDNTHNPTNKNQEKLAVTGEKENMGKISFKKRKYVTK